MIEESLYSLPMRNLFSSAVGRTLPLSVLVNQCCKGDSGVSRSHSERPAFNELAGI